MAVFAKDVTIPTAVLDALANSFEVTLEDEIQLPMVEVCIPNFAVSVWQFQQS